MERSSPAPHGEEDLRTLLEQPLDSDSGGDGGEGSGDGVFSINGGGGDDTGE